MAKKRYDVIKWKTITTGDQERNLAYKVGGAYETDSGAIQCDLPDGVSISGNFTISPWKSKDD